MSNPVDYFQEAFGGFAPHRDHDAALKFALDELVVERRFDDLLCLVKGRPGFDYAQLRNVNVVQNGVK